MLLSKIEKEKMVIKLANQGKTTRYIAKEVRISLRSIGQILNNGNAYEIKTTYNLEEISQRTQTANGPIISWVLRNVFLSFKAVGTSYFTEYLNVISISKPNIDKENDETLMDLPSSLGMDILKDIKYN